LRFTDGTEKFIPLGENEAKHIQPGEYSYIDDSNEIICYLDVKQIDKTKVTLDTKNVFIVVQGNTNTPFPHLENAVSELLFLIKRYCGGEVKVEGQIENLFDDYKI
jgi:DNA/RNA-binding domain of Phe-tRNA-synthetase-like protein